jgi:hypothetical protein
LVAEHPDLTLDEIVAAIRRRESAAGAPPFGGFSHGTRSRLKKVRARGGAKAG